MKQPAIVFHQVNKSFSLHKETSLRQKISNFRFQQNRNEYVPVLKDVSFEIKQGETVGLFGPNGSGKSTLLRMAAEIIYPDSGEVHIAQSVAPVIELGSGLHPELSGLDNIFLYASILGVSKKHLTSYLDKIISFSELSEFMGVPLKKYSSGMKARLAFSVAIFSEAKILLFDEIFAVGDGHFRDKSIQLLQKMKKSRTILLTSHDLGLLQQTCDRTLLLSDGMLLNEQNQTVITFIQQMPLQQWFVAEAKSNSMYPLIKEGDAITIQKIKFSLIQSGDVIAFCLPNIPEIIVHRIVDTKMKNGRKVCFTKGDNTFGLDSWEIESSHFLGKVVKIGSRRM